MNDQAHFLAELVAGLSRPEAYPHPAETIEVRQTHISIVFLAGDFVYKIKKPVNLGFLDFSTLERRRHFCAEEVRLNRRLALEVYLGVVPVTRDAGRLRVGGAGSVVEWTVRMKRLPAEATLENYLLRHEVEPRLLRALAARLARFHQHAETNERIASFARFDPVAQNARDNFKQTEGHVAVTVHPAVHQRVLNLTEKLLQEQRSLIENRAERGVPRDTHGDLRLDHVYLFPEQAPPSDLVIIDCIEFSDRFRYADPVADAAFLVMDLAYHGRRDLSRLFAGAYFEAAADPEGAVLLPFYSAYRAVVRAKVDGMELGEEEIDAAQRRDARLRAKAHWLLALEELETPIKRPALLLIGGLPGAGKSTLAQALAQKANFHLFRSDTIRKSLASSSDAAQSQPLEEGIYDPSWTERTYTEMLARVEECWWRGERALVDASFRDESQRQCFLRAAVRWGVAPLFLHCRARANVVRARLEARRGDASDADWNVHQALASRWDAFAPFSASFVRDLETSGTAAETLQKALTILQTDMGWL